MRMWVTALLVGATVGALGAGCMASGQKTPGPDLDQTWSAKDRTLWYEASQGSRLIPLAWLQALRQPGQAGAFLDDGHVARLGYLPYTNSSGLRLPVGFAVDRTPAARLSKTNLTWSSKQPADAPWVGLNCSACHTAEITYQGTALRVDGGPALSDFQKLVAEVRAAMAETRAQPEKFKPFAEAVLGQNPSEDELGRLRGAMDSWLARERELERLNAIPVEYGYGRVDAFGHIYNKTAYAVGAVNQKANPSDAPVSYPFLWNIVQHDRVQWNGQVPNKKIPGIKPFDVGAMGRNVGEVIGVFADIEPVAGDLKPYRSSVDVENLDSLEKQIGRLRPPAWPSDVFKPGPDHQTLVDAGEKLFHDKHCSTCHVPLARTDLSTPIKADMSLFNGGAHPPPGTDPWMACNAYARTAKTGVLKGTKTGYFGGPPMGEEAALADLVQNAVSGVLVDQKGKVIKTAAASIFGIERPPQVTRPVAGELGKTAKDLQLEYCMKEKSDRLGYKARPLTGIWATAPYLHNGSVPTLNDLLKAPKDRPPSFFVGSREFDPVNVGYLSSKDAPGNKWEFKTVDASGAPIPGNSNAGHDYNNAAITPDQRKALIEYLKTL